MPVADSHPCLCLHKKRPKVSTAQWPTVRATGELCTTLPLLAQAPILGLRKTQGVGVGFLAALARGVGYRGCSARAVTRLLPRWPLPKTAASCLTHYSISRLLLDKHTYLSWKEGMY